MSKYTTDRKQYYLDRYHRRRHEAIQEMGGKCVKCGSIDNLEFDHIDRSTKTFDISTLWGVSIKRYKEELLKCQLLCKACHKIKSDAELTTRVHGTPAMYRKGKCRCELCVKTNSQYIAGFKRKRRLRLLAGQ